MSLMLSAEALVLMRDAAQGQSLAQALKATGHAVRVVTQGNESSRAPLLAFVEIGPEVPEHLACIRRWRADGTAGPRLLVGLVRPGKPDDELGALNAGVDAVWTLPVDPAVLPHRLAHLERRWSEHRVLTVANRELREQQRLLQTMIDTVPHRMFIKDRDRRYLLVNRALATFFGLPIEQILGRTANEFTAFLPETKLNIDRTDAKVLSTGVASGGVDEPFIRPDGTPGLNHVEKIPLRDDAGNVIGISGITFDITDVKRSEEALRTSQELLQTLLDTLPMYVTVKDREGRYTIANRRVRDSVSAGTNDIMSHTITEVGVHQGERLDWVQAADRRVLDTGEPQRIDALRTFRQPGVETWERVVKLPLRNGKGEITGVITVGEDITELKKAEAERLRLERQFQHAQKLESLGVLAGGIAHDFNNLLTSILGNAELALLQLDAGHPASGPLLNARTASLGAAALTRQMLDYAGKGHLTTGPVRINAAVQEIVHLLRVSIPRTIDFKYQLAEGLPAVEADASQLQQVVMNLITNAAEAIGENPGIITVTTGVESLEPSTAERWHMPAPLPEGVFAYVEVRDSGRGMTEEIRGRIFEPFFTTKFTGRGLGLAAVLGIVQSHHGLIGIETAPGRGSAFRVWLPVAAPAVIPVSHDLLPVDVRSYSGLVLLVDDEPMVRDVLRRQLELMGFSVETAANGREALDTFASRLAEFSLVVLDATMPVMGGKETLAALKGMRPSLRVILCSGYDEEPASATGAAERPDAYLKKPVSLDALRDVLNRVLPAARPIITAPSSVCRS